MQISMSRMILSGALCAATVALGGCGKDEAELEAELEKAVKVEVFFETAMGKIRLELNAEKAPVTVKNFVDYVRAGFYDGTIFHRVIPDFVIQGGGFDEQMRQKTTRSPIVNEADNELKNLRGAISMARTSDPNSATSQFFINLRNNPNLDRSGNNPGYAVFGRVTKGMDIIDKIARVETGNRGGHQNVPTKPIVVSKVTVQAK